MGALYGCVFDLVCRAYESRACLVRGGGVLIGGLDDLIIDLIWIGRSAWRSLIVYRRHARVSANTITAPQEPGRLALFVATWHEEAVIGGMVSTALRRLRHPDWRLWMTLALQA